MVKASDLLPVVSDILFREWDPIGVNDNDLGRSRRTRRGTGRCR